MKTKKQARLRRAAKTRRNIHRAGLPRLAVFRSARHIYAQLISADGVKVLAAASTLDKALTPEEKGNKGVKIASSVGKMIGERALAIGVKKVAFDRSGYKYHGRVKALADSARETGLDF